MSDLAASRSWRPARSPWQDRSSPAAGLAAAVLIIAVFGALSTLVAVGLFGQ